MCLRLRCRTSCKIFEEFSTAVEWIAYNKLGIAHVVHIFDDFFFIKNSKQLTMQVSGNQKLVSIKKKECTDDMAMWLVFLENYNGKTVS